MKRPGSAKGKSGTLHSFKIGDVLNLKEGEFAHIPYAEPVYEDAPDAPVVETAAVRSSETQTRPVKAKKTRSSRSTNKSK